jgi:hypothetical protein
MRHDAQLLRITEYVTYNPNERAYTAAIFFEVFKAYGPVWTTGPMYKLHTVGIQGTSHLLSTSYLTDRKFTVTMEGFFSEWKPIRVRERRSSPVT